MSQIESVFGNLGVSILFGVVGIFVLALGYIIFDKLIPLDFNKELEKGNLAVGVLIAGLLIAIALIVSRVVAA